MSSRIETTHNVPSTYASPSGLETSSPEKPAPIDSATQQASGDSTAPSLSPILENLTPHEAEALSQLKESQTWNSLLAKIGEEQHELWGIPISTNSPKRDVVLMKFLRAHKLIVPNAVENLVETLKWRRDFRALETITEPHAEKFQKVGFIFGKDLRGRPVTYNIYSGLDNKSIFGDLDAFLRWRVGLMERAVQTLDFEKLDQLSQIHDYLGTSLFRMDAGTKKASRSVIKIFQRHYPELLAAKYFVNVPRGMEFVFSVVKPFLSADTIKKFVVLADSKKLVQFIPADELPEIYGGKGKVHELSL
ncbi:Phosphatidylinositol transfer protein SFH5 [Neolecta irregularis DAH-3]|uniref:Phosphatidylinositol transfer protein SFH5 n=1 Tax=Neolecta irregularis (strain DAH-3) TaxID=1198029 RepID=A0A1U7LIX8_NEOID|nr:Phosphatidylinositol transfer protein SFH5 [Neolecta irregularis DAH-3]|eukprot:OLL22599.1 Phosphatidylinositol transfer protein SFH5 [Neolecta irregularis DAH-3]